MIVNYRKFHLRIYENYRIREASLLDRSVLLLRTCLAITFERIILHEFWEDIFFENLLALYKFWLAQMIKTGRPVPVSGDICFSSYVWIIFNTNTI